MAPSRTALLIRCSKDEASTIRAQAAAERRTISGCILKILERSVWMEHNYAQGVSQAFFENRAREFRLAHRVRDPASILLRCSHEEADRIRSVAWNRGMSISEFVVFSLWRHWEAATKVRNAMPQRRPAAVSPDKAQG